MKVGDVIEWWWRTSNSWEPVRYTGLIVGSSLAKTDREKILVYRVLSSDRGNVIDVREDSNISFLGDSHESR